VCKRKRNLPCKFEPPRYVAAAGGQVKIKSIYVLKRKVFFKREGVQKKCKYME
jgi:hypothetical protein